MDYRKLADLSPRVFGKWGENYVKEIIGDSAKYPSEVDENFDGTYDLALVLKNGDFIRVEVKSTRAINTELESENIPEYEKMASKEDSFKLHFQHIKPNFADLFIFVVVWKDMIEFYLMLRKELLKMNLERQTRDNDIERQLFFYKYNYDELERYMISENELRGLNF